MLEVFTCIAISVVCAVVFIIGAVELGRILLMPRDERELMAERAVWRDKKRALNASVQARRVRS